MRTRSITIKPDGTVHVRTYLRAATPLKQLFDVKETQRSGLVPNPDISVSENTIETAKHNSRKNSELICLVRHNRQKK